MVATDAPLVRLESERSATLVVDSAQLCRVRGSGAGHVVAVVGQQGGGKSTFMNILRDHAAGAQPQDADPVFRVGCRAWHTTEGVHAAHVPEGALHLVDAQGTNASANPDSERRMCLSVPLALAHCMVLVVKEKFTTFEIGWLAYMVTVAKVTGRPMGTFHLFILLRTPDAEDIGSGDAFLLESLERSGQPQDVAVIKEGLGLATDAPLVSVHLVKEMYGQRNGYLALARAEGAAESPDFAGVHELAEAVLAHVRTAVPEESRMTGGILADSVERVVSDLNSTAAINLPSLYELQYAPLVESRIKACLDAADGAMCTTRRAARTNHAEAPHGAVAGIEAGTRDRLAEITQDLGVRGWEEQFRAAEDDLRRLGESCRADVVATWRGVLRDAYDESLGKMAAAVRKDGLATMQEFAALVVAARAEFDERTRLLARNRLVAEDAATLRSNWLAAARKHWESMNTRHQDVHNVSAREYVENVASKPVVVRGTGMDCRSNHHFAQSFDMRARAPSHFCDPRVHIRKISIEYKNNLGECGHMDQCITFDPSESHVLWHDPYGSGKTYHYHGEYEAETKTFYFEAGRREWGGHAGNVPFGIPNFTLSFDVEPVLYTPAPFPLDEHGHPVPPPAPAPEPPRLPVWNIPSDRKQRELICDRMDIRAARDRWEDTRFSSNPVVRLVGLFGPVRRAWDSAERQDALHRPYVRWNKTGNEQVDKLLGWSRPLTGEESIALVVELSRNWPRWRGVWPCPVS